MGDAVGADSGEIPRGAFLAPVALGPVLPDGGVPCEKPVCRQGLFRVLQRPDEVADNIVARILLLDFSLDLRDFLRVSVQGEVRGDVLC